MTSSSFPDVNVWLALLVSEHVHHRIAKEWWNNSNSEFVGFCRFTQMGVLRLLTNAAAMDQQPLTVQEAWQAYDEINADERVSFYREPDDIEKELRARSQLDRLSPKVWADAYLLAFASLRQLTLVTFDHGLRDKPVYCLVLG